jgi:hypothetical protein
MAPISRTEASGVGPSAVEQSHPALGEMGGATPAS